MCNFIMVDLIWKYKKVNEQCKGVTQDIVTLTWKLDI